jgi:hypothetical protein
MKPVFEADGLEVRTARTSTGLERIGLLIGVRLPPGQSLSDHAGRLIDTSTVKSELDAGEVADFRDALTDWLRAVGRERE